MPVFVETKEHIVSSGKNIGILFVCRQNAARSQMAEGLGRALLGKSVRVWSAGSAPAGVHPMAIQVMEEIGIDISSQRSKSTDDDEIDFSKVTLIVKLCDEGSCPVVPGNVEMLDWPLPDPVACVSEQDRLMNFRLVRDELKRRVESLRSRIKEDNSGVPA